MMMIMLMMVVILMLEPRFGIRVKGGVPFEVLYFFFNSHLKVHVISETRP